MMTADTYHVPVLLRESVDGLDIQPDGVYVDTTFGGGGHSKEILSRLGPKGLLCASGQETLLLPLLPCQLVNTTGAGDAFWGGMLYCMSRDRIRPADLRKQR